MKTTLLRSWKLVGFSLLLGAVALTFRGPAGAASVADEPPEALPADTAPAPTPVLNGAPSAAALDAPLSPAAAEIVRLAQAGVAPDVMLAFIANSTSLFNLSSSQIIYINDLGIPGTVVGAMIQHDLALKAGPNSGNPAVPPPSLPVGPAGDFPGGLLPPVSAEPPPPPPAIPGGDINAPDFSNYTIGNVPTLDDSVPGSDSVPYFYDSLAPYGNWVYLDGYGWCWQPTVELVNPDWQPYSDRGRWIDSDCGWYWYSDYSWGWAAFHYGRWFCDGRRGWVWRPGREWSPAWVSWRRGADYCGWAPLPPWAHFAPGIGFRYGNRVVGEGFDFGLTARLYNFIPIERMVDYTPSRYRATAGTALRVFESSSVINRVTVANQRIINHGIDPFYVAQLAQMERRPAVVRDASPPAKGQRWEQLDKAAGPLMISRPALPAPGRSPGSRSTAPAHVPAPTANHSMPLPAETAAVANVHPASPVATPAPAPAFRPFPNMNLARSPAAPAGISESSMANGRSAETQSPPLHSGNSGWQAFQGQRLPPEPVSPAHPIAAFSAGNYPPANAPPFADARDASAVSAPGLVNGGRPQGGIPVFGTTPRPAANFGFNATPSSPPHYGTPAPAVTPTERRVEPLPRSEPPAHFTPPPPPVETHVAAPAPSPPPPQHAAPPPAPAPASPPSNSKPK